MGLCVKKKKPKDEGGGCVGRIVTDNVKVLHTREENSFKIYPLSTFLVSAKKIKKCNFACYIESVISCYIGNVTKIIWLLYRLRKAVNLGCLLLKVQITIHLKEIEISPFTLTNLTSLVKYVHDIDVCFSFSVEYESKAFLYLTINTPKGESSRAVVCLLKP